jgi:alpha-galactosidase
MMQYGIQIWTSDNTDPNARTVIQSAAMMAYPAATMSCHVSNPHGDMKSLDYRYKVAVGGMLGYELNILKMTDEIRAEMKKQIAEYKEFEHLMRLGEYYNLASPVNYDYSSYYYTNEDASEIIFTLIERPDCKQGKTKLLKIKVADSTAIYTDVRSGKKYSGEELKRGLTLTLTGEKDSAQLFYFKKDN